MNSSSPAACTPSQFDELGFSIIPDAVPAETLEDLIRSTEFLTAQNQGARIAGTRHLASLVPAVGALAASPGIAQLLETLGATGAFRVRSIFFDKHAESNWKVPWHQDLTIAVREKREVPGFGPWSVKGDVPHVQPPRSVLERMVTLRLHLDDCDANNGALKVLTGSHRFGILGLEEIQKLRSECEEVVCEVPRGGILAMHPLLLHASSPALHPRHRRVIHLEFATASLPDGLEWFESGR